MQTLARPLKFPERPVAQPGATAVDRPGHALRPRVGNPAAGFNPLHNARFRMT